MRILRVCTVLATVLLTSQFCPALSVTRLTLINADTDSAIPAYDPFATGTTLDLSTLPTRNLNVQAHTDPPTVGSVRFAYDGNANYRTENVAPYAFAGDNSGNYNNWTPSLGSHTLTATPYPSSGAGGTPGTNLTVTFDVIDGGGPTNIPAKNAVLYIHGSSPPALSGHLLRLNDTGGKGFSQFAGALAEIGLGAVEVADTNVTLDTATLNGYKTVVFSSNNRRFTPEEQSNVVDYVENGGGILLFSDSAFGFDEGRASDNDIAQHFNMLIHHDNYGGVYTVSSYLRPHPITDGITFKGEGVSMVRVLGPPAEMIAPCQGGNCTLHATDGPIQSNDAILAIAEVGDGRVAVTFDRNTFFNPPGAGTHINEVDNRLYAQRLLTWLVHHEIVPTNASVSGELKKWHCVTLDFPGPASDERATPNPFRDYLLEVTFVQGTNTHVAQGYFAADGNAAETSATGGNVWRCHFAPPAQGAWSYESSFRFGADVAAEMTTGTPVCFHGSSGSFVVAATDKTGRDLRGKGLLEYVGTHHLRFAETGEYFLKCGADAPENFLAYEDFDGGFKSDGRRDNLVKSWHPHTNDWQNGDPDWQGGKGRGMIGALNYLASEGMNAYSFIPMNIGGDDKNVFPYLDYNERYRFDCSRLDQWEIVFAHADTLGMYQHFKTLETENELLLDGGDLGVQRTLYYRELIARFAHHLAMNWNLGEEINNASTAQKKSWAEYFWSHDPYQHNIVIHNGANHYDLLGPGSKLTGFSLQTNSEDFRNVHGHTLNYITRSVNAGKPWVVACDEPGDANHALRPDSDKGNSHVDGRKYALWGNFMAGGAGVEWYFGYQHAQSDLTCQDWRSRDTFWDVCRHALDFFYTYLPFWQMENRNDLIGNAADSISQGFCLAKTGEVYAVYLPNGGTKNLDLGGYPYEFTVNWYDPRYGGGLQDGSVATVSGPGQVSLGTPPSAVSSDWVILVKQIPEPAGAALLGALLFAARY